MFKSAEGGSWVRVGEHERGWAEQRLENSKVVYSGWWPDDKWRGTSLHIPMSSVKFEDLPRSLNNTTNKIDRSHGISNMASFNPLNSPVIQMREPIHEMWISPITEPLRRRISTGILVVLIPRVSDSCQNSSYYTILLLSLYRPPSARPLPAITLVFLVAGTSLRHYYP